MHSQCLVIHPRGMELADLLYYFQEVDKTQEEKISDDRCNFYLTIPEEKIPTLLDNIRDDLEKDGDEYLEVLNYRSFHTYDETREEYGSSARICLELYKYKIDCLKEYVVVKDLPCDDPRQIQFIKTHAYSATEEISEVYIKGRGYGTFRNPYELWDYYTVINEHRFPKHTMFLVDVEGFKSNRMGLDELDVPATVGNINELTCVWEHIIFCKDKSDESVLFTTDEISFKYPWNKHCLVNDLEQVLKNIQKEFKGNDEYIVKALDFHI
ncbi:MAG: hypothetical protein IJH63_10145 [Methanobrevibacter sp.]|nr:hypothetical protein [Methanosphaera sp.]MBR0371059.1 hypothetical protein [Methanobrevibacter sp.]